MDLGLAILKSLLTGPCQFLAAHFARFTISALGPIPLSFFRGIRSTFGISMGLISDTQPRTILFRNRMRTIVPT